MVTKVSEILEGGVAGQFAVLTNTASGLNIDVAPGIFVRNAVVTEWPTATTLAVTDDTETFIYIETITLVITANVAIPAEDYVLIAKVTAASGVITAVEDYRARSVGVTDTV